MARTAPTLKKPTLAQQAFIADTTLTPSSSPTSKPPQKAARSSVSVGRPPKREGEKQAGYTPAGDKRLTVNLREDLHKRLRVAAAMQGITVGQVIEDLVGKHLPEVKS